jgi:hypothetical protein
MMVITTSSVVPTENQKLIVNPLAMAIRYRTPAKNPASPASTRPAGIGRAGLLILSRSTSHTWFQMFEAQLISTRVTAP